MCEVKDSHSQVQGSCKWRGRGGGGDGPPKPATRARSWPLPWKPAEDGSLMKPAGATMLWPMTSSRRRTSSPTMLNLWVGLLVVLLLMANLEVSRHQAEANTIHRRIPRRAYKLCSQNLSDAMQILCKDRGYNEPFSSGESGDIYGPGLANECCRNSCTIEQMEQYCKPRPKAPSADSHMAGATQLALPSSTNITSWVRQLRHRLTLSSL